MLFEKGKNGGTVHFIGLLSDGNVHSNISQLFILINKCAELGIEKCEASRFNGRKRCAWQNGTNIH